MSSRLMASKLPSNLMMDWIDYLVLARGYIQTGTTYTSPSNLNSNDFPYMTGRPARGPMLPYPSIEVPSVTIADSLEVLE